MSERSLNASPRKLRLLQNVVRWALCVLIAFVFLMAGLGKLIGRRGMVMEFERIGLGQWFRYFTGLLEVTGAIGVLIPRFSRKAALVLATVMAGAIFAHLTVLSSPPTLPAVLLALTLILTWIRH
jgi:putative oxidoreductase